jgi:hypothetical protein
MLSNRSPRRIARSLAGMLAVLTVAAPVATASPIDPALHLRGHGAGQAALQTQTYVARPLADRQATHGPVVVSATADDGFDWGSAGIGGGIAVAAVALCAGLALAPKRHSAHPAA